MYGDIGHGAIVLFFGVYLFYWKKTYDTQRTLDKERVIHMKNSLYLQDYQRENVIDSGNHGSNRALIKNNSLTDIKRNFVENPGLEYIFKLRYLFVLVGVFSLYSGFVYNDFLSIMPNFFESCWQKGEGGETFDRVEGCVYPFGFDWRWSESSNSIEFFNSFKMKFAIIIGVIHMSFGILLSGANAVHFGNYTSFFFQNT